MHNETLVNETLTHANLWPW